MHLSSIREEVDGDRIYFEVETKWKSGMPPEQDDLMSMLPEILGPLYDIIDKREFVSITLSSVMRLTIQISSTLWKAKLTLHEDESGRYYVDRNELIKSFVDLLDVRGKSHRDSEV